jgi:hypothetical protein
MNMLDRMWSTVAAVFLAMLMLALWVWPKFFGVEVHPIFGWAEAQTGAGWLEPGLRYVVGGAALLIALALFFDRTRLAAGWAAFALSLAFIIAHASPMLGVNIPSYEPLMAALAAGRTAAEIQAMGLPTDKGAHMTLAFINLGLAAVLLMAEHAMRKPEVPPLHRTLAAQTA